MKQIARDQNQIGPLRDDVIYHPPEGVRHIGFALVDALRRLAMVLPEPQVEVREMRDAH
jgi:hypothetical protein